MSKMFTSGCHHMPYDPPIYNPPNNQGGAVTVDKQARDEFERAYAESSGVTVERLHQMRRYAARCDCGGADCAGWQMMYEVDGYPDDKEA